MKQAYICDFCGKVGTEEEILQHEKECIKNPALKRCITCKHCYDLGYSVSYGFDVISSALKCTITNNGVSELSTCDNYENGEPSRKVYL